MERYVMRITITGGIDVDDLTADGRLTEEDHARLSDTLLGVGVYGAKISVEPEDSL